MAMQSLFTAGHDVLSAEILLENALSMAGLADVVKQTNSVSPSASFATLETDSICTMDTFSNSNSNSNTPLCVSKHLPPVTLTLEEVSLLRSVTVKIRDFDSVLLNAKTDFIPILEARGGSDKNSSGLRADSLPIGQGIADHGGNSAVYQYQDDTTSHDDDDDEQHAKAQANDVLVRHLLKTASGVVVRVNPGTLSSAAQSKLDVILTELSAAGILVMSTPNLIRAMGAKDALVKIRHLQVGLEDTAVYTTAAQLYEGFRKTIAFQPRVMKQNRGSQGEGIWICKLADESKYCKNYGDAIADLDTPLILVEAVDNHEEYHTVGEFLEFCLNGRTDIAGDWLSVGQGCYLEGGVEAGAMMVDQRFLPRIVEGEVRCTMVGSELVGLLHKKPKEGGLSATLKSGAVYTNYEPDAPEFSTLVERFTTDIPHILKCFGVQDQPLPLLWTADFIFGDKDEHGKDTLYVGEFNCYLEGGVNNVSLTSYYSFFLAFLRCISPSALRFFLNASFESRNSSSPGEFNCSCVGVTQQIEFADLVGKTAHEYCTTGFEKGSSVAIE